MIRATTKTQGHKNRPINLTYGCAIDNNVYSYKMVDDGICTRKIFRRVKLGYGWENQRFAPSCEIMKGEGDMAGKTGYHKQWLPWDELMPKVEKLMAQGYTVAETAASLGIKKDTLWKRLNLNKRKQTPKPEGDQPEPAQGEASAEKIIPEIERTYTAPLMGDTNNYLTHTMGKAQQEANKSYPLTLAMLDDIADDRRSALSRYCENQAVASLRKRWAGEVFENHEISRGRKLELIGWLIDAGVE